MKSRITRNLHALYWRFFVYEDSVMSQNLDSKNKSIMLSRNEVKAKHLNKNKENIESKNPKLDTSPLSQHNECVSNSNSYDKEIQNILQNVADIMDELKEEYNITESIIKSKINSIYFNFLRSEKKISTIDSFFNSILRKFAFFIGIKKDFEIKESTIDSGFIEFLTNVYLDSNTRLIMQYLAQDLNMQTSNFHNNKSVLALKNSIINLHDKSIEFKNESEFKSKLSREYALNDALDFIKEKNLNYEVSELNLEILKEKILNLAKELANVLENTANNMKNGGNVRNLIDRFLKNNINEIMESKLLHKIENDKVNASKHIYLKNALPSDKEAIDSICENLYNLIFLYFITLESSRLYSMFLLIENYKKSLQNYEKVSNILSFDSITHKVFEIISDILSDDIREFNSQYFYFRLDSMISHILFDEYQDTSIIQYRIFMPLFSEILAGSGTREFKSLFFVGDSKQSLYGFRGANIDVFHHTQKLIENKSLNVNYRSNKNIVKFVNEKFSNIFDNYVEQHFLDSKNDGFVDIEIINEKTFNGNKINLETQISINKATLAHLQKLLNSGVKPNKIAILARKNNQLESFLDYAREQGFKDEFNIEQKSNLTNKKAIQIITNAFKIYEYNNEINKLTESNLDSKKVIESVTLNFTQDSKTDSKEIIESRIKELKNYRKFTQKILNKLLGLKYNEHCKVSIKPHKSLAKQIKSLIESLRLFHSEYVQDCLDFLELASSNPQAKNIDELLEIASEVPSSVTKSNAITLSTIHKSKGLEYDFVIYFDCKINMQSDKMLYDYHGVYLNEIRIDCSNANSKSFLSKKLQNLILQKEKQEKENEKNIMYVACTRPKIGLKIIATIDSPLKEALNLEQKDSKGSIESTLQNIIKSGEIHNKKPIIISYLKTPKLSQEEFIKNDIESNFISNIFMKKRQIQGLSMHLILELILGYKMQNPLDVIKSKYGFYLDKNEMLQIYNIANNFIKKDFNKHFDIQKSVIKCELSFLQGDGASNICVNRLDSIIFDGNKFHILEFKTSENLTESLLHKHTRQLQNYISFVDKNCQKANFNRFSDNIESSENLDSKNLEILESKGYLIYLQEKNDTIIIKNITKD